MRHPLYLRLEPDDDFDFTNFFVEYANGRPVDLTKCKICDIPYPLMHFKEEFIKELAVNGLSNYLNTEVILEHLTTPRNDISAIEGLISQFLENIGIDEELIIIDPYFFAPNVGVQYVSMIENILSPFLNDLRNIKIITASHSRAFSAHTKNLVETHLTNINPSLAISHSTSNELHDRFWVTNNRKKGILTGTSLNGFGRKYSVIDYLQEEDVLEIINEFSHLI